MTKFESSVSWIRIKNRYDSQFVWIGKIVLYQTWEPQLSPFSHAWRRVFATRIAMHETCVPTKHVFRQTVTSDKFKRTKWYYLSVCHIGHHGIKALFLSEDHDELKNFFKFFKFFFEKITKVVFLQKGISDFLEQYIKSCGFSWWFT